MKNEKFSHHPPVYFIDPVRVEKQVGASCDRLIGVKHILAEVGLEVDGVVQVHDHFDDDGQKGERGRGEVAHLMI